MTRQLERGSDHGGFCRTIRPYLTGQRLSVCRRPGKDSFQRFWDPAKSCLYDVIDGSEGDQGVDGCRYDSRLWPNQIVAVALPHSLQDSKKRRARELLASFGLRSLAGNELGCLGRSRLPGRRKSPFLS